MKTELIAKAIGLSLTPDEIEGVANDQLRMVWTHAAVGTLVATAFALVMAVQFRSVVDPVLVNLWVLAKVAVVAPRVVKGHSFRLRGFPTGSQWRTTTYCLLALDGLVWGAAGYWLMRFDVATASLGIASLGCVACVAAFGFQASKIATTSYVVPIIIPMVFGMVMRFDQTGFYYATGLTLLLVSIVVSASRSDAKMREVFVLRIHSARISAERASALELVQRESAAKTQFLGTVSHELRTPIHGMLGVARLVHVETSEVLTKQRMELIESSGTHLLRLVTDLIDVSRIDSGQMKIHHLAFDLWSEVQRLADIYSVRAAEKGLAFTLDCQLGAGTWVRGDPVRTRQVLHNLLGNAIKFTQEGWVQLAVVVESVPGRTYFRVRDTGVGITEEDQKSIFDAFHQVDSVLDGRRQGTGLGLTIAREIATLLGGSVTVQSKPNFGSIFEFSVQFEAATAPEQPDARTTPVADDQAMSARILLAEDNDVNFLIASSMLANQGHQVERVSDGDEAVRRALRDVDRPDLVLMDCMMPKMNGFDATRSIREQEAAMGLPRIPIIALSAIADDDMARNAIDSGMDDTLGKPFTIHELKRAMHPWLALRESQITGALAGLSRTASSTDRRHLD